MSELGSFKLCWGRDKMSSSSLEPLLIYSNATFLAKAHKNDRKLQ